MKQTPSTHRRIPNRHTEPDVLSLRFSDQEKSKILRLAEQRGQPATRSLMELVESALDNGNPRNAMSIIEIMELPAAERQKLFEEQARDAAQYYKNGFNYCEHC